MARKKEAPKPISDLRFQFVDSLENVCTHALMLLQAVDLVVQHDDLPQPAKGILTERARGLRIALIGEDVD